MNKMRDDFDAWYELNGKSKPFTTVSIKEKMFESWKASRESLVVELPDRHKCLAYDDKYISGAKTGHNKLLSVVIERLKSAGINVVQR